jgi:predicted nucleic acid-binding protein
MRYVVDANILFSALYEMRSNAGDLLHMAIEDKVELFSSEHVMNEMLDVLVRKLGYTKDQAGMAVGALPVRWVEREIYMETLGTAMAVLKDEADASLIACAAILRCDVISGDKQVLAAKFRNVKVRRLKDAVTEWLAP